MHREQGTGAAERTIASVAAGRVLCTVRATGYVGETRRLELERDREAACALTLRRFGTVSGTVRCDGVPVAGALVRIAMPDDSGTVLMNLSPEDRAAGSPRSDESDGDGRYRFEAVPAIKGMSVVAASFDCAPVHAAPLDVEPGEEATADFDLVSGTHLAGTIVDASGAPCAGATVSVLRKEERRGVTSWEDEARARTDEAGHFVTPALAGPATRMLKAWVVVDGVQQVIQHEEAPPQRGTKDVGTLAPHPGTVRFELEVADRDGQVLLTVAVNGDPPGVGQTVVLAGASFDREGRVRIAGLPTGEGSYSAVRNDGSATVDGQFRATGRDLVVRIPALKARQEQPVPVEQLVVDIGDATADGPAFVALLAKGDILLWRQVERNDRTPIAEHVAPGTYTLYVRAGDRYGEREITQVEGQDQRVSLSPDRTGRTLSVLVLDGGKPVPHATVTVRGFRGDSRGQRAPWAVAGEDGHAVLRALPRDVAALTITAFNDEEFGRGFTLDLDAGDEATVDLAEEAGHRR